MNPPVVRHVARVAAFVRFITRALPHLARVIHLGIPEPQSACDAVPHTRAFAKPQSSSCLRMHASSFAFSESVLASWQCIWLELHLILWPALGTRLSPPYCPLSSSAVQFGKDDSLDSNPESRESSESRVLLREPVLLAEPKPAAPKPQVGAWATGGVSNILAASRASRRPEPAVSTACAAINPPSAPVGILPGAPSLLVAAAWFAEAMQALPSDAAGRSTWGARARVQSTGQSASPRSSVSA